MKGKKRKRKNKLFGRRVTIYPLTPEDQKKLDGLPPETRARAIDIFVFLSNASEDLLSGDIRRTERLRGLLRNNPHLSFMLDDMISTYPDDDDVSIEGLTGADLKAAYQSHIVNPGSLN